MTYEPRTRCGMSTTDRLTLYLTFLMTLVMFTAFTIKLIIVLLVTT